MPEIKSTFTYHITLRCDDCDEDLECDMDTYEAQQITYLSVKPCWCAKADSGASTKRIGELEIANIRLRQKLEEIEIADEECAMCYDPLDNKRATRIRELEEENGKLREDISKANGQFTVIVAERDLAIAQASEWGHALAEANERIADKNKTIDDAVYLIREKDGDIRELRSEKHGLAQRLASEMEKNIELIKSGTAEFDMAQRISKARTLIAQTINGKGAHLWMTDAMRAIDAVLGGEAQ